MIANEFSNVLMPSDTNGTGMWRMLFPVQTIWSMGPSSHINNSVICRLPTDPNFYKGLNSFMVQRLVDPNQEAVFAKILFPQSKMNGFWTIYNIDDAMHYKDIVPYNRGRRAFIGAETQDRIKRMLNNSDFVLVTTDYIKEYYHKTYDVPLENIIAIPNYLPRWWIGSYYDIDKSCDNFKKFKNKPRIGMVSSLSHYNIENIKHDKNGKAVFEHKNGNVSVWKNEDNEEVDIAECERFEDDLDLILDCIKSTVDDFQWVFFGYAPPQLKSYIEAGKIEYHPGISIMNYPAKFNSLHLQAVVAPIRDGEFNRCKSNIKYLEAAAEGVPLFAQNMITYSKYMPENQLFNDSNDLKAKLLKFKFMSMGAYRSLVENQWKFINKSHHECGIDSPNWWMEDNISIWMKLFSMRRRSQPLSIDKYLEIKQQKSIENQVDPIDIDSNIVFKNKLNKDNDIIFENNNGIKVRK